MGLGHDRERQVKARLEAEGYVVIRAAGSLGIFDLIAAMPGELMVIEVKATGAGPWHSFGPEKRKALRDAAARAGGTPILAWWPSRGALKFIPASEWPND